ncbi:S-adenosyl-L-methionine-dependent methyltransferase [Massarina eburnea CBS 473.64]|uniref:S-adenosyl-L-methionine-dependent methyltransferase n=1 Tax=Massarina eburnea CBS 473.64 TaxID=1395130 RepID=A0A6A6RUT7_9PLEO|nr:S-adenosyl-L-methionine-dependent methyltransferase [Massarina eburnea CBS 473.64]
MQTSTLVQALNSLITSEPTSIPDNDKAKLFEACSKVAAKFQSPDKELVDMYFGPLKAIALRLAIDMRIFDFSVGKTKVSLEELSRETGCEDLFIKRVLRIIISMGLFKEVDKDVFETTPAAKAYMTDAPMAQIIIHLTETAPVAASLPSYFAQKGYTSPAVSTDCPFQYAMQTPLHNFAWIAADPKRQRAFNTMMTIRIKRSVDSKWFEVFPVSRIIDAEKTAHDGKGENGENEGKDVFLVDIGGGIGHQTIDFKTHFPGVKGRCVVQDIAPVISTITDLPTGIEAQVHDFLTPQPIYAAKIYFLAHVLHDWPDKEAGEILGHVRDAMGPESVVLLSETLMPERDASFVAAAMDLTMMAAYASLERTETQFRELLESIGFEVVEVWREKDTESGTSMLGQAVIEARLRRD